MKLYQRFRERLRQHLADRYNLCIPETQRHTNRAPVSAAFRHAAEAEVATAAFCYCGRFHFATLLDLSALDATRFEDDDSLQRYRDNARNEPARWVEHVDREVLHTAQIDRFTFVLECDCNMLRYWEDLFWRNRFVIAEYFRLRASAAQREAMLVDKVARDASEVETLERGAV